ncbi:hypothetical protein [Vallitalea sp.]|jgi:hypothetical protein|uniref:hypothetical protein n=1 Tax=Vallitalea sp. TaxID=1882829 RepID=UPI0025DE68A9|nr:hypothetical protein [Vallitalea sp.]MCT4688878.1 hypothetical protein [Vallitalea sp.]
MIFISNIREFIPPILNVDEQKSELLPFYNSTYERLYSKSTSNKSNSIKAPIGEKLSGKELILKALDEVYISRKKQPLVEPLYYFDIRSSEDYSTPAPDYYILNRLGIKHAKALNIRGVSNVALIHMLKMAKFILEQKEDYLLVSISQRLDPDDFRGEGYILADGAIAFICNKNKGQEEGYYIKELFITESEKELLCKISDKKKVIGRNNQETMSLLCNTIIRDNYLNYDFGCMDYLLTLEDLRNNKRLKNEDEFALVGVEDNKYTMITVQYMEGVNEERD